MVIIRNQGRRLWLITYYFRLYKIIITKGEK